MFTINLTVLLMPFIGQYCTDIGKNGSGTSLIAMVVLHCNLKKRNIMKSVLNYVTAVAFLFTSAIGFANRPESIFGKKDAAKNEVEKKPIHVEPDPVFVRPVFVRKGEKLFMNLLNLAKGKVVVKIYDSEDRVLYTEAINGDIVIEKAFNFEKAFEDRYTVVVIDGLGTYKRTIEIK